MKINECQCGCGGNADNCTQGDKKNSNYMFFENLKSMKRMIEDLIQLDPSKVEEILNNGHAWAVDHIASSSDDIQEVYNFLKNENTSTHTENDAFKEDEIFVKAFESFIKESNN